MGQYYLPINIDKRQYLYSHDYHTGLKLMEQSWIGNAFVNTVFELLMPDGPWYMNRIVWAGDYMDDDKFLFAMYEPGEKVPTEPIGTGTYSKSGAEYVYRLHSYAKEHYKKIKPIENDNYSNRYKEFKYLINHTKKEFVNLSKCPVDSVYKYKDEKTGRMKKNIYKINPLPILTCSGNGQGGGDYHGTSMELVETWCGEVISLESKKPKGFKELIPNFKESI